ncbi:MAG TPA: hypothetical protein VF401_03755 [Candidatus Saccharimonadales bacterium]
MSSDEADQITNQWEQKWTHKRKRTFLDRMERKLNNKYRSNY